MLREPIPGAQRPESIFAAMTAMLLLLAPVALADSPTPASETQPTAQAETAPTPVAQRTQTLPALGNGLSAVTIVWNAEKGAFEAPTAEQNLAIAEQLRTTMAERLSASRFAPAPNTPEKVVLDSGMERLRLGIDGIRFSMLAIGEQGEQIPACVHGPRAAQTHLETPPRPSNDWAEE